MSKSGLPEIAQRRRPVRPPRLRSIPTIPKGPRMYRQPPGSEFMSGPGEPPPGFIMPTNSVSEWWIYWALSKVLKYPKDPRVGPFIGYPGVWSYQAPFEGGRAMRGGQVIDFIVDSPSTNYGTLALRIQTERYHIMTSERKRAQEIILGARIARHVRMVDIYEQDFMMGPNAHSGLAAIMEVKRALYGGTATDPLKAATARRIR